MVGIFPQNIRLINFNPRLTSIYKIESHGIPLYTIMSLVPNTGNAIIGVPHPHMNIAWRCATRASIDVDPASFLSQVICGTFYLLLPFHPLTICLLSKVGCMETSEPLIINNIFIPFQFSNSVLIF